MTAPTFLAPFGLSADIVLIETIAREGGQREAEHTLRTARKGALGSRIFTQILSETRFATSPLASLEIEDGLPRRSL